MIALHHRDRDIPSLNIHFRPVCDPKSKKMTEKLQMADIRTLGKNIISLLDVTLNNLIEEIHVLLPLTTLPSFQQLIRMLTFQAVTFLSLINETNGFVSPYQDVDSNTGLTIRAYEIIIFWCSRSIVDLSIYIDAHTVSVVAIF